MTPLHAPSTTASIPSKYQTFFAPITEKKGFRSQAPRFADQLDVVSRLESMQDLSCPDGYRMTVQDPAHTLLRKDSRKQIFLFRRGGLVDLHQRYICLYQRKGREGEGEGRGGKGRE